MLIVSCDVVVFRNKWFTKWISPWLWKWIGHWLTALASLQLFLYIFSICMGKRNSEDKYALAAWKANRFLGCIRQSVARWLREVTLLCSAPVRHIWRTESSAGLPSTRETRIYWSNSREGLWRWLRDWSICCTRRGCEGWDCSIWGREGSRACISVY